MGTEPESVDAQKGTMKDIFARCLKKNIAQVCTLPKGGYIADKCVNLLVTTSISFFVLSRVQNMRVIQEFIFHRLKINHESHEFILDPGTIANTF
jgi:hypothetical protein